MTKIKFENEIRDKKLMILKMKLKKMNYNYGKEKIVQEKDSKDNNDDDETIKREKESS